MCRACGGRWGGLKWEGGGQSTRRCVVLVGRALNQESYSLGRALALALTRLASCVSSLGLHFSFCKMELIIPALPCPALPCLWDVVGNKPVLLDRTALETADSELPMCGSRQPMAAFQQRWAQGKAPQLALGFQSLELGHLAVSEPRPWPTSPFFRLLSYWIPAGR